MPYEISLSFAADAPTWSTWIKAAEATQVDASRGIHFSHPDHSLQAAIDGAGVVLGWLNLAKDDIAAGRLIQPFDLSLELGSAFYLVYPTSYAKNPKILSFKKWLLDEIVSQNVPY